MVRSEVKVNNEILCCTQALLAANHAPPLPSPARQEHKVGSQEAVRQNRAMPGSGRVEIMQQRQEMCQTECHGVLCAERWREGGGSA